jgi:hypothetical protein
LRPDILEATILSNTWLSTTTVYPFHLPIISAPKPTTLTRVSSLFSKSSLSQYTGIGNVLPSHERPVPVKIHRLALKDSGLYTYGVYRLARQPCVGFNFSRNRASLHDLVSAPSLSHRPTLVVKSYQYFEIPRS